MKRKIIYVCFLFICLLITGCKENKSFTVEYSDYYLVVGEEVVLKYHLENFDNPQFDYEISNDIISIESNTIKGLAVGECTVKISIKCEEDYYVMINVYVEDVEPTEILTETSYVYDLYSEHQLEWQVLPHNASQEVEFKSYNTSILEISDSGMVKCLNIGSTVLLMVSKADSKIKKKIEIEVKRPDVTSINTNEKIEINYNDNYQLEWSIAPMGANTDVTLEVENSKIINVKDGNITALCPGETILYIRSKENPNVFAEVVVIVKGTLATFIATEQTLNIEIGEQSKLNYKVYPNVAYPRLDYVYDSSYLNIDDNGNILAYKKGICTIKLNTIDGSNLTTEVTVNITGESVPKIFLYDSLEDDIVNWGKDFDPLKGVMAFDGEDGNITDNIQIDSNVNTKEYGTYTIAYSVNDSDNNQCTLTRTINVVWNYNVTFIGHGGCYYGAFNSEEAILYAVSVLKYQAIEVDLKQTKDGVFVLSHDPKFGSYNLEDYTWDELKDVTITETRKSGIPGSNGSVKGDGTYTAKLCTLETYLKICKEYNVKAVIELKTSTGISNWTETYNASNSKMPLLIKQIEDAGMINDVILLSNQYECLIWTRKNGYDFIECQYLVSCCENQEYLDLCIKYDLDISMNVRDGIKNSDEWLEKYKSAGLKIAAYTFEEYASYETLQSYIDRGFDYVTVDWHDMSKLNLPE